MLHVVRVAHGLSERLAADLLVSIHSRTAYRTSGNVSRLPANRLEGVARVRHDDQLVQAMATSAACRITTTRRGASRCRG